MKRLGTDWIDLCQIHRPEPDTDIDETTAERAGRERFVCEQPPYSLLVRGVEADVLPTAWA